MRTAHNWFRLLLNGGLYENSDDTSDYVARGNFLTTRESNN